MIECMALERQPSSNEPLMPSIEFRHPPRWKRIIDIVASLSLLIALAPLLVIISLYVRLVSRGPILFCQSRVGAGLKPFEIYKFRTMIESDPRESHRDYVVGLTQSDEPASKPDNSRRLIPGGGWLRSMSLDELPQLVNVLFGSMSLIGPRPEVLQVEDYEPWQLRRFEVLPGISGLWQVSGKNRLTFKRMVELDIEYVDRHSFALDLEIMLKTIGVICRRNNR